MITPPADLALVRRRLGDLLNGRPPANEDEAAEEERVVAEVRAFLADKGLVRDERFTKAIGQAIARAYREPDGVQPATLAVSLLHRRIAMLERSDDASKRAEARIMQRSIVASILAVWGVFDFGADDREGVLGHPYANELMSFAAVMEQPPPEWLITDVLPAAGVTVLYGPSGSYKSFVALDLAAHFVLGRDWCGKATALPWGDLGGEPRRRNRALYVAAEGNYADRNTAWYLHHGKPDFGHDFSFLQRPVNLLDPVAVDELLDYAYDRDCELIVIDTLARATAGADENTSKDMGQALDACSRVARETDAAVLLVHHTGKDPSRGERGSSAIRGALDASLEVTKTGDLRAVLKTRKQRDADDNAVMPLRMQKVSWEGYRPGSSLVVVPGDPLDTLEDGGSEKLAQAVSVARRMHDETGDWPTKRALAKEAGVSDGTAFSALKLAKED